MSLSLVDRIIYCNTIFTVFADKHLYFNMFSSLSGCCHLLLYVVIDAMLPQVKSLRTDSSECFCISFSFFKELLFLACLPLSYRFYFLFLIFPQPAIPPRPVPSSPKQQRYELLLDKPGTYPTMPRKEENHVPHSNSTPGNNCYCSLVYRKNKIKHGSVPKISMLVQIGSEIL